MAASTLTPSGNRYVVAARLLFSDRADADRAAALLDSQCFGGLLAAELVIEEL